MTLGEACVEQVSVMTSSFLENEPSFVSSLLCIALLELLFWVSVQQLRDFSSAAKSFWRYIFSTVTVSTKVAIFKRQTVPSLNRYQCVLVHWREKWAQNMDKNKSKNRNYKKRKWWRPKTKKNKWQMKVSAKASWWNTQISTSHNQLRIQWATTWLASMNIWEYPRSRKTKMITEGNTIFLLSISQAKKKDILLMMGLQERPFQLIGGMLSFLNLPTYWWQVYFNSCLIKYINSTH